MSSDNKINVFFNEYNLLMGSGGVTYLPFVSGILCANAKKITRISENFKFHKFIFHPDTAENIINNYYKEIPHIATFSISMWNEQLSLKVAKILKDKFNHLLIAHHLDDLYENFFIPKKASETLLKNRVDSRNIQLSCR